MARLNAVPLPKTWPQHVKTALIHTISLATTAFIAASGRASNRKGELIHLWLSRDSELHLETSGANVVVMLCRPRFFAGREESLQCRSALPGFQSSCLFLR